MLGVPGRQIGWISEYGVQLDIPLIGDTTTYCKYTGKKYRLIYNELEQIP